MSKNVIPIEVVKLDRTSGEFVFGAGVAGTLVERKRRVEREQIKDGLRIWLERKAREIRTKKRDGGVGVLVWRFSRSTIRREPSVSVRYTSDLPKKEKVNTLKRFWESLAS